MFRPALRIALPLAALLLLGACNKADEGSAAPALSNDPAAAVMNQVNLLNAGKIDELLQAAMPPEGYQAVREEFVEQQKAMEPSTEEERQEFAAKMQKLTAPDAEETLFNEVQPLLKDYNSKYKAMMPMYIGMGQTMAGTAISQSKELSPEQKKQADDVLSAVATWVQNTDWGDESKARQAIAVVTATAREVDIKDLDQVRALSYDDAMAKYGKAWGGVRKVLAIYGMDVGKALDAVKAKTVSQDGDSAVVEVDYSLFDKPMQTQMQMTRRDGRWYSTDMLNKLDEAVAEAASAEAVGD